MDCLCGSRKGWLTNDNQIKTAFPVTENAVAVSQLTGFCA
jgi:hypothetical protein